MNCVNFNANQNLYQYGLDNKKNVSFQARFPLSDIKMLVEEQHVFGQNPRPEYPQIYTLLERIAEFKGSIARFTTGKMYGGGWSSPDRNSRIEIDGNVIAENIGGQRGHCLFETLKQAVLGGTKTEFAMPMSVYEQKWWEHRNVTKEDIYKLALEVAQ